MLNSRIDAYMIAASGLLRIPKSMDAYRMQSHLIKGVDPPNREKFPLAAKLLSLSNRDARCVKKLLKIGSINFPAVGIMAKER